ncbi:uncharacterized protein LOC132624075 [Lycium barbarum]|uniref:uncharacterized protein LOC132624075 n=1 Tax=Lycium barbarum TaxID=112863 RepID=UPI00293E1DBB|nr:uncharacterized protein LOC132624075 [Lycium barbarum]
MARRRTSKAAQSSQTLVTPDTSSIEGDIQLCTVKGESKEPAVRKLQFSDTGISAHPTPTTADIVRGNRSDGMSLTYVPPTIKDRIITVTIEEDDLKNQKELWESAIIGYVVGDTPYANRMEGYVTRVWNFVTKPMVLMHDEGYYIFKFNSIQDKDKVLKAGPYYFNNKPLILKTWELDFNFEQEALSVIPIWVKFLGLPAGYWSPEALSKIASVVGKPLYTDEFTANAEKISYARILMEADVSQDLPDSLIVETPSGPWKQAITYDWKPKFCNECIIFGHDEFECWNYRDYEEIKVVHEDAGQFPEKKKRKPQKRKHMRQEWLAKTTYQSHESDEEGTTTVSNECAGRNMPPQTRNPLTKHGAHGNNTNTVPSLVQIQQRVAQRQGNQVQNDTHMVDRHTGHTNMEQQGGSRGAGTTTAVFQPP